jgi:hypothetical protein
MGIRDLLLLMLFESAALAFAAPQFRVIQAMPAEAFRSSRLLALGPTVLDHLSMGLVLFGLAVLARDRWHRTRFAWSPVHWYFLIVGPVAAYLPLAVWLQQPVWGPWLTAHYVCLSLIYGIAALVAFRSVLRTEPRRWRAILGLLTMSLLLVALLGAFRLAEMHANALSQYRLHLIAAWVTTSIVLAAAAWTALFADSLRATWHDWLAVVALITMTLNSLSLGIAFWPVLARLWADFYSAIVV